MVSTTELIWEATHQPLSKPDRKHSEVIVFVVIFAYSMTDHYLTMIKYLRNTMSQLNVQGLAKVHFDINRKSLSVITLDSGGSSKKT